MSVSLNVTLKAEVFDVEELVQEVWAGSIRIPDFQRPLRWGFEDARRLFDSILRGYPVGNLLLWARSAMPAEVRLGALVIDSPALDRALWVVDGQQRVTTLANALSAQGSGDERFSLSLDLVTENVVRTGAIDVATCVPLPVLFDLQELLRWFRDHPEAADYFDTATGVAKRIRQAKISASVVETPDEEVLRDIFDRVNNYGKRLTRAEVFAALHPGAIKSGEPNGSIEDISTQIAQSDQFGVIDGDTILRCVLARRGADITREIRLEFDGPRHSANDFPGEDVGTAYRETLKSLTKAVQFLQREVGVPHFSFLPYRHLLIVLVRLFSHHELAESRERALVRRWFWRAASAGPGMFPGSTTGTARALCTKVIPGDLEQTLKGLLDAVPDNLLTYPDVSKFRTNHATGKIIVCAMWSRKPRSVITGRQSTLSLLSEILGDSQTPRDALAPVVSRDAIRSLDLDVGAANSAARWLLMPEVGLSPSEIVRSLEQGSLEISSGEAVKVRESHFLNDRDVDALADRNYERFVVARSEVLQNYVEAFLDSRWERGFETVVSIDNFVFDDIDSESEMEYLERPIRGLE